MNFSEKGNPKAISKYQVGLVLMTTEQNMSTEAIEGVKNVPKSLEEGKLALSPSASPKEAPLSKKALKRKAREELWEDQKLVKRKAYKDRKKERKRQAQEAKNGGETAAPKVEAPPMSEEQRAELREERLLRHEQRVKKFEAVARKNFTIIIDCKWDALHNERNMKSLGQQIMQSYGYNKACDKPVQMYVTGIEKGFMEHFGKFSYKSWMGTTVVQDTDYIDLPQFKVDKVISAPSSGTDGESVDSGEERPKQLVYLSSDAEETLDELDPNCAYIIGGIVDRNAHKGIAHKKAVAQNIRTVKLPIGEHLKLHATHVLTVNHVFQLLLERHVTQDWSTALHKVIPERKTVPPKPKKKKMNSDNNNDNSSSSTTKGDDKNGEEDNEEGGGEE